MPDDVLLRRLRQQLAWKTPGDWFWWMSEEPPFSIDIHGESIDPYIAEVWRGGDAELIATAINHLPRLLDLAEEVARLRRVEAAAREMMGAYDPEWPGACPQECFDTSDGHGYARQEAAIRQMREALAG